jgi:hypothetical protein
MVALGAGGSGTGLGLVLTSKQLLDNKEVAAKITKEQAIVSKQIEEAIKNKDSLMQNILQMRLRNLNQQEQDNNISILKNALSLMGGALGVAVAVKSMLIAVGLTVWVGASTAISATGIGAAVLGGVALAVGLAYLWYKNRHAIQNQLQNKKMTAEDWSVKQKLMRYQSDKSLAEWTKKFSENVMSSAENVDVGKMEAQHRNKVIELTKKINELKAEKKEIGAKEGSLLDRVGKCWELFIIDQKISKLEWEVEKLDISLTTTSGMVDRALTTGQMFRAQSMADITSADKKITQ